MRNKTTIITIILDAAIILAVALFMFVIRPWDKADKKNQADYAPAPELTIAEQEGIDVDTRNLTAVAEYFDTTQCTDVVRTTRHIEGVIDSRKS